MGWMGVGAAWWLRVGAAVCVAVAVAEEEAGDEAMGRRVWAAWGDVGMEEVCGGFDPSGVAAVVLVHGRPERLETQVGALLGQTCAPGRVWVLALGGFGHARGGAMREALQAVEEGPEGGRVVVVRSSRELGVVARLDVGVVAARTAEFVWHLDDDQLPGPRRLEYLLSAAARPEYRGAACFSGHGWRALPADGKDYRRRGAWHDGRTADAAVELRVGCGSWFLNASHAERVLAADPPFRVPADALAHTTGEDILLAWRLRAALGVRTFALPEGGRPEWTANAAPAWGADGRQLTGQHNPHAMAARERLIAAMNTDEAKHRAAPGKQDL